MNTTLASTLALLTLCAGVSAQDGDIPGPQPQEVKPGRGNSWFEELDKDLGTYLEGESAKGEFRFKNATAKPHKIHSFLKSCACAAAKITVGGRVYELRQEPTPNAIWRLTEDDSEHVEFITVEAGQEGVVQVRTDLRGVNGQKGASLQFQTTDQKQPMVSLQWRATAAQYFMLSPSEVNLNKMHWDDQREFTVRVTSPIAKDFEITGHDELPDKMQVEYEKTMQDGAAIWIVRGKYGPDVDERAGGGVIKLHTDVEGKKVDVRVIAWVEGPLTVTPGGFLPFGRIKKGEGATKMIEIVSNDEFDLQVTKVEFSNLTIDEDLLSLTPSKDGKTLKLELAVSGDAPARLLRGDLVVHLNHPVVKSKEFQFNGYVR